MYNLCLMYCGGRGGDGGWCSSLLWRSSNLCCGATEWSGVETVVQCHVRACSLLGCLIFVRDVSCGFVMVEIWDQSCDTVQFLMSRHFWGGYCTTNVDPICSLFNKDIPGRVQRGSTSTMARSDMTVVAENVYKFLLNYIFLVFIIIRLNLTNLQYGGMPELG